MPTLDSQVHAYERNHPGRPWIGTLYGPPEVTGDQMAARSAIACASWRKWLPGHPAPSRRQ